jgi:imidazole glycerol-phosphate synthase subunit HisF
MNKRVIARLDVKGPNLVKGIHMEGLRVLGKPDSFATLYYEQGIDELVYIDVVASLYQRNSLLDIIERTSRRIFIPLTVGGGIRTTEDIRRVLKAGADKVALNTAIIKRPEFISEAAQRFGSSTIVASIEAIRRADGSYEAYTDNGRERTGVDVLEWSVRVAELGAGEIMVTSIDREGTGRGFDCELTSRIAGTVNIPVIACGGAGNVDHLVEVLLKGQADAVCLASLLHYNVLRHYGRLDGEDLREGNTEYLRQVRGFSLVQSTTLAGMKARLLEAGIPCRPASEAAIHV